MCTHTHTSTIKICFSTVQATSKWPIMELPYTLELDDYTCIGSRNRREVSRPIPQIFMKHCNYILQWIYFIETLLLLVLSLKWVHLPLRYDTANLAYSVNDDCPVYTINKCACTLYRHIYIHTFHRRNHRQIHG